MQRYAIATVEQLKMGLQAAAAQAPEWPDNLLVKEDLDQTARAMLEQMAREIQALGGPSTGPGTANLEQLTEKIKMHISEEMNAYREVSMSELERLKPPPPATGDLLDKSDLKKIRKVIQETFDQEMGLKRRESIDALKDLRRFSYFARVLVDHMDPKVVSSIRRKLGDE